MSFKAESTKPQEYQGKQVPQQPPTQVVGVTVQEQQTPQNQNQLPEINLSVKELPSKGHVYPNNAEIKYRPYTFGEIKKINQSKMNTKQQLEMVINCITTNFYKYNLTIGDLLYMGFLIKLSTMGTDKVQVVYKCPKCDKKSVSFVKSLDLEFDEIGSNSQYDKITFPLIANLSGNEYKFKPLSVTKYFELLEEGKHFDETAKLAKECYSESYENAYKVFYNAVGQDAMILEQVDDILYHGLKPVTVTCSNKGCGFKSRLELEGGEHLIVPFRERQESNQSRIYFGNEASH